MRGTATTDADLLADFRQHELRESLEMQKLGEVTPQTTNANHFLCMEAKETFSGDDSHLEKMPKNEMASRKFLRSQLTQFKPLLKKKRALPGCGP